MQTGDEQIYIDGDQFFEKMHEAIRAAQNTIYLETYIFDQDNLGLKTLKVLAEAAARGVKVHLLIDGVGSSHWTFHDAQMYRAQGIELKFFHPLAWQRHPSAILMSLTLQRILTGFYKLNHRNHRKICIVDEKILFICSMNVSDRHLKSISGELAWRDTGVQVTDEAVVREYLETCREAWEYPQQFFGRRWVVARRQKKKAHRKILNLIHSAKQQIWITNPYFVPDFQLFRGLAKAARSGLDVKILVPMHSDIFGLKFAMQGFYTALLKKGCQIFEYRPSILHAKILIVDNWASVGSTNLDYRSIFYNLEADLILAEPKNIQLVKDQFVQDLKVSNPIILHEWNQRSWYKKILQRFFLFFRGAF